MPRSGCSALHGGESQLKKNLCAAEAETITKHTVATL